MRAPSGSIQYTYFRCDGNGNAPRTQNKHSKYGYWNMVQFFLWQEVKKGKVWCSKKRQSQHLSLTLHLLVMNQNLFDLFYSVYKVCREKCLLFLKQHIFSFFASCKKMTWLTWSVDTWVDFPKTYILNPYQNSLGIRLLCLPAWFYSPVLCAHLPGHWQDWTI